MSSGEMLRGIESVSFFSGAELESWGIAPEAFAEPAYVKARGILEDVECSTRRSSASRRARPRSWTRSTASSSSAPGRRSSTRATTRRAIAGLPSASSPAPASTPTCSRNLLPNARSRRASASFSSQLGNDKDFLADPRLVQAEPARARASTSRPRARRRWSPCTWRVRPARRRVRHGAGRRRLHRRAAARGYLYREGGILSPDGHCRAFDAQARRARSCGNGVGIVVLKRLADALARRRPHPRRHPGLGGQQRRRAEGRLHRAERRRPGRGDRRGAGAGRRRRRRRSATSRRTAPARRWAIRSRSRR